MPSAHTYLTPEAGLTPTLQAGLALLWEAHNCANNLNRNHWDFSLDLETLQNTGLSDSQIRWLLCQGYVQQAIETTPAESQIRTFLPVSNLRLNRASCFILTNAGIGLLDQLAAPPHPATHANNSTPPPNGYPLPTEVPPALKPHWLADRQELRLGNQLIKKYRRPAGNQMTILTAFERNGWPYRVANPLRTDLDGDAVERLHDAIKRLNHRQHAALLRFHGDGTGTGVTWEIGPTFAPAQPLIDP